jgi:glutaredoxin-like protein NrdH
MPGEPKPRFYMLSTCIWCRRTKKLLDELGVEYEVYVMDQLPLDEKKLRTAEVREATGRTAFPTILYEGGVIVGYNPQAIKKAFEK